MRTEHPHPEGLEAGTVSQLVPRTWRDVAGRGTGPAVPPGVTARLSRGAMHTRCLHRHPGNVCLQTVVQSARHGLLSSGIFPPHILSMWSRQTASTATATCTASAALSVPAPPAPLRPGPAPGHPAPTTRYIFMQKEVVITYVPDVLTCGETAGPFQKKPAGPDPDGLNRLLATSSPDCTVTWGVAGHWSCSPRRSPPAGTLLLWGHTLQGLFPGAAWTLSSQDSGIGALTPATAPSPT